MSNGFTFSARSLSNLAGVHPDLQLVVKEALILSDIDFMVLEGKRTLARQKELVAIGASHTMNSRHLTGHAVDLAPYIQGGISWHWPHYHHLAGWVKKAAEDMGVPIEWGGDWATFKDGPHWQLPWKEYP